MALPSQDQSLAEPDEGAGALPNRSVPPRTPYEEVIASIWRDLLGQPNIGVFDDFFAVGGHSLLAPKIVARIRKTLGVRITVMDFFSSPTVAGLAAAVAAHTSSSEPRAVSRRPPDAEPVLSFDQQRLWLENQLLPGAAYNVHVRRRVRGPLDIATLEASTRAIIARHEILRTRFPTVAGRPVQVVDAVDRQWHLVREDYRGIADDQARDDAALRRADEDATTPFDLASGPLFRFLLIALSDTEHLICITSHHIICDAWSIGLFVRELSALYQAGGDVERAGLPTLPVQYRDFAVWQREQVVGEVLERDVGYWREHLHGAPPTIALPIARRRLPPAGASAERVRATLCAPDAAALSGLCRAHGVTVFMVLLAGLATVLGRWSGQPDVVIGVPIARRNDAGTDQLIGFFVNTLPLRIDLSGDPTFAELLERVRQSSLNGYAHADAPLDVLVKEVQVPRDPRRTPLFQVVLNVLGSPEREQVSGVLLEAMEPPALPSKFDLALQAQEVDGTVELLLDVNADRFQTAMMRIVLEHITTLIRAVLDDATQHLSDYQLSAARQTTVEQTTVEQTAAEVIPASARPAAHQAVGWHAQDLARVAVIDAEGPWSYRWLDRAADQVAQLLARRSAPQSEHLGVVRRPTAAFAAAVLGCMKAGASFSVIEAAGPVEARFLGVSTLLDVSPTTAGADATIDLSGLFRDAAEPLPADPSAAPRSSDPDVLHPRRDWAVERFDLGPDDRFAVLSTRPGHQVSALSSAFHAGATLVLAEQPVSADIAAVTTWLQINAVTVVYTTPPVLRAITAQTPQRALPALRYAFIDNTGDLIAHDVEALRRTAATCRCVGLYRVRADGRPLAAYAVPEDWRLATAPLHVPLGTDLAGAPLHLRHPSGQPATIGEVAEICAGSYATGDLGRRWPDGTLEFIGDPTVDPVDTVAALRDLPGVRNAVVTEHIEPDGRTTLVGYVVGPARAAGTAGIRQRLLGWLPEHLIPEHLFVLEDLPLTSAGEDDSAALPQPEEDHDTGDSYVAPRTPMEHQLTGILQELLGVERVGIQDGFFDLAGFSLLATRLTARIRETFGVELTLRSVFEAPTIDGLAQLIVRTQGEMSDIGDLEALLNEIGSAGSDRG